jgi:hypothetical protein
MTIPSSATRPFGLTALYRLVASWSLLYLGVAYTGALSIAVVLRGLAWRQDWVIAYHWIAPLIAVIAFSLVFTVLTWYHDEDTVTAAVLLIILTTVGYILAYGIADLVFEGSIGALVFGVASGFITTVVRAALFFPIVFVLVWGGRRLRPFFAPGTLNDENLP